MFIQKDSGKENRKKKGWEQGEVWMTDQSRPNSEYKNESIYILLTDGLWKHYWKSKKQKKVSLS